MVRRLLTISVLATTLLTGCQGTPPKTELTIVTTFFPYYVFVKNIVGENVNVVNLIQNSEEPHEYQLKPSDLSLLTNATIVVKNGLGLDDWVDEAVKNSGSQAQVITGSAPIQPLAAPELTELVHDEAHEDDDHGDLDPHVWLSPKNASKIVTALSNQIDAIDTDHDYKAATQAYLARLQTLDSDISTLLADTKNKEFISFHPAFHYFANDYGLKNTLAIEPFPGKEPTPRYLTTLITLIKEKQLKAIFSEPQFSPRIVETLAQDLNLQVFSLDPMETGTYTPTAYEDISRKNAATMHTALSL